MNEALYHFDVLLVNLVSSLDALARFTHLALGMKGEARSIGWQMSSWLSSLRQCSAALADLAEEPTFARYIWVRIRSDDGLRL